MGDLKPSSKVTASALAGVIVAVVATVASFAGYDLNLNPEVALWIATGIMFVIGFFTREKIAPPSLIEAIEDGKTSKSQVAALRNAIDVQGRRVG